MLVIAANLVVAFGGSPAVVDGLCALKLQSVPPRPYDRHSLMDLCIDCHDGGRAAVPAAQCNGSRCIDCASGDRHMQRRAAQFLSTIQREAALGDRMLAFDVEQNTARERSPSVVPMWTRRTPRFDEDGCSRVEQSHM
jgi:hypothetical protein